MRIFNESKTTELIEQDCNLTKGYLKEDYIANGEVQELIYVYIPYNQKQLYMKLKRWSRSKSKTK